MKVAASGRMCEELEAACKKYGPLVRVSGNALTTNDPEVIIRMGAARSPYRRSNEYKAARLDPTSETVLSVLDETKHAELRAKMSAGYSGKDNPHLEKCIDNRILDLVKLIEDKYISEGSCLRPMDFARKAQYFTLDVITDIAFGEPFGDLTADEDVHEYLTTIDRLMPVLHWITVFPDIADLAAIPWIGRMVLPSSGDDFGVGKVMGVAKKAVAERYRPGAKVRADMVGSFLRHGITQEEAETASLLQIIAGAETTATAMRCTLLHIITQPKVYATLQSEIDEAVRTNSISTPVRDSEARELPYLIACIREGLRIWPPAPSTFSKVVPPEGDTLASIFVPGGTKVSICVWGVQRNKSVFGEDVDVYRPERWLGVSEEQRGRMERTNDLIFGPGRYQCLGRSIAMIELRKVFVEVGEVENAGTSRYRVTNTVAIAPAPLRPGADKSRTAMEI
ncbi:MAG: hypothetical protein M1840_005127 [Geoglossum simile]|nr:MAG: hypothetical protein M1840_005127 [Geoglossum simile]